MHIAAATIEDLCVIPDFASFSAHTIESIRTVSRINILEPGETLFKYGDTAHIFYAVIDGGVRVDEHGPDGKEVGLKLYGRGDFFGLLTVSETYTHVSTVIAVHHSRILSMDGMDARSVMLKNAEFAVEVVDLLVKHVHHAHERIRAMATERVDRRLARTLLKYAEKFGESEGSDVHIVVSLPQRDLANFIGSTVESVNCVIRQWSADGLLSNSRMQFTLHDVEKLREIINGK